MERYSEVPGELKELKQWVGHKNKVPINAKTGRPAKSNDKATWSDFKTAVKAVEAFGLDGVGFQFDSGYFGVDLDNVIKDNSFTKEAIDIIGTMASYTEYSPSGRGVHILCKGEIKEGFSKRRELEKGKSGVELYSHGRYFTVTGRPLVGASKQVEERSAEALKIQKKYLAKEEKREFSQMEKPKRALEGMELIEKAKKAKGGEIFSRLWAGEILGGSQSEADLSLVNHLIFWTGGDKQAVDALFRQSGLYRAKWDEKRGALTYGTLTIKTAFEGYKGDFYSGGGELELPQVERVEEAKESFEPVSQYLEEGFFGDIERFKKYKDRKTGFEELDRLSGGLYPGLYVIGAVSSLGKTTFIHQLCDQLAERGDFILFFSLEQSRFELVTKSLSRLTAIESLKGARSAIEIRRGEGSEAVAKAVAKYKGFADRVIVKECSFDINALQIVEKVKSFVRASGQRPIVVVDYLQIIPPADPRQSDKEKTDSAVRALKKLQSELDLVVFVVSSLNRVSYIKPVDFESFKESGGIEYTADVLWGLQLEAIKDLQGDDIEKKEILKEAKKASPRKIELICLKNRFGVSSYECSFDYYPAFDLFKQSAFDKSGLLENPQGRRSF